MDDKIYDVLDWEREQLELLTRDISLSQYFRLTFVWCLVKLLNAFEMPMLTQGDIIKIC